MNKMYSTFGKIFLFSIPFIAILLAYFIIDPYMVLYKYKDYNRTPYVHKNVDFITTQKYLINSDSITYDSYIFGGSTALYISPTTYKGHLDPDCQVYSFIGSAEHIYGIWSKIKYIDSNVSPLKNALLIFDTEATFDSFKNDTPMSMKHYKIYPSSKLNFHYQYFLDFVNIRFLIPYFHYRITHMFYPYMDETLLPYYYYYDPVSNEYHNVDILDYLKTDSLAYYESRRDLFKERSGEFKQIEAGITQDYLDKLIEIKDVFSQNNTSYRIVIGPAYHQKKFNEEDVDMLNDIFGQENVFDFSGINWLSESKSNFYDELHFKKYVGDELLELIYN